MSQDKDIVKIGKKKFLQTTKLNWKAGDNEPIIHMDFSKPKTKGLWTVPELPWLKKKKKKK